MNVGIARKTTNFFIVFLLARIIAEPFVRYIPLAEFACQMFDTAIIVSILIMLNTYLRKKYKKKVPLLWLAAINIIVCVGLFFIHFSSLSNDNNVFQYLVACFSLVATVFYFVIFYRLYIKETHQELKHLGMAFLVLGCSNIAFLIAFMFVMSILYKSSSHTIAEIILLMLSCLIEIYLLFAIKKVFASGIHIEDEDEKLLNEDEW